MCATGTDRYAGVCHAFAHAQASASCVHYIITWLAVRMLPCCLPPHHIQSAIYPRKTSTATAAPGGSPRRRPSPRLHVAVTFFCCAFLLHMSQLAAAAATHGVGRSVQSVAPEGEASELLAKATGAMCALAGVWIAYDVPYDFRQRDTCQRVRSDVAVWHRSDATGGCVSPCVRRRG